MEGYIPLEKCINIYMALVLTSSKITPWESTGEKSREIWMHANAQHFYDRSLCCSGALGSLAVTVGEEMTMISLSQKDKRSKRGSDRILLLRLTSSVIFYIERGGKEEKELRDSLEPWKAHIIIESKKGSVNNFYIFLPPQKSKVTWSSWVGSHLTMMFFGYLNFFNISISIYWVVEG